ncbi:MAG: SDR family oxidoreductase [Puniceicoccales bacterium]|jgi:dTDP-4-dehydrorhamnose reductase|nr:SDR family oxidoreductase [Puniceicoccales bacterium]
MKIILTGASGFLGREVAQAAARRGHQVIALCGAQERPVIGAVRVLPSDLSEPQSIERLLLDEFPDAIINCAAASTLEACDANPDLAQRLNVALPQYLAKIANHLSARLIHISTDMVFDGARGHYAHTDTPAPLQLYGETKLAGEKEVLQYGRTNAVVLRVPLLSGNSADGTRSLHERLLALWAQGLQAVLFTDEIRQPVSAGNLADVLVELCERNTLSGVYHWAGTDALSRYEIGRRIAAHLGLEPDAVVTPASGAATAPTARRPRDLSLNLHPLQGKLKTRAQAFAEILSELQVPSQFSAWHTAATGQRTVRRLVKGVDF